MCVVRSEMYYICHDLYIFPPTTCQEGMLIHTDELVRRLVHVYADSRKHLYELFSVADDFSLLRCLLCYFDLLGTYKPFEGIPHFI